MSWISAALFPRTVKPARPTRKMVESLQKSVDAANRMSEAARRAIMPGSNAALNSATLMPERPVILPEPLTRSALPDCGCGASARAGARHCHRCGRLLASPMVDELDLVLYLGRDYDGDDSLRWVFENYGGVPPLPAFSAVLAITLPGKPDEPDDRFTGTAALAYGRLSMKVALRADQVLSLYWPDRPFPSHRYQLSMFTSLGLNTVMRGRCHIGTALGSTLTRGQIPPRGK